MGHHGAKDNLVPLIDRLNRYPIGLFDNDKLRRILVYLFSEEEAYVASRFPLLESTLEELCRAVGLEGEELEPLLEKMAEKGLVMDTDYGGTTYYLLLPGLIGFFEFSFMKQRADLPVAELAALMSDYLYDDTGQAREFFGSKTPLTRVLPYDEHIPVTSVVTSYERAVEIVRHADFGGVGQCYCRHKKEHLGATCERGAPSENICISLGNAARFMTRRGFARYASKEELLQILQQARQHNLTHITDNIRDKPSFICNCCSCCCELLAGIQQGFTSGVAKAGYTLAIDDEICVGCGTCAAVCNVVALSLHGDNGKRRLSVDTDRCLGCGACISVCKVGGLTLVPCKRPLPPKNKTRLFVRILREKNRLSPFLRQWLLQRVSRAWHGLTNR